MHLFAKQKCFLFLINWILMKNWLSNAKLTFEDKSDKPCGAKSCPSYACKTLTHLRRVCIRI